MENLDSSKLIPTNTAEIKLLQSLDTKYQLQLTQERINTINNKLKQIADSSPSHLPPHPSSSSSSTLPSPPSSSSAKKQKEENKDWTKSYQQWENWTDQEELLESKRKEEANLESLISKADNLGHIHSHTEEREFFQKPEDEKIEVCRGYRTLGNYLIWEGSFVEAIEAYETSIGYYEYCFPEEAAKQKELDEIRIACYLNVSMCYLRIKEYRKAIEAASNAIRETEEKNPKAFYRRGQAYRFIDDYAAARDDLTKALELAPKDKMILEEIKTLKIVEEAAKQQQSKFASSIFREKAGDDSKDGASAISKMEEVLYEEFIKRGIPQEFQPDQPLPFPQAPDSIATFYRYIDEYIDEDMLKQL